MNLYPAEDYQRTLIDLGIDKRQYVYLEQVTQSEASELDQWDDQLALLSVRLWDTSLRRSTSLRDFIVPKSFTLRELKEKLAQHIDLKPEEMVLVEEETEKTFNILQNDEDTLKKYGIIPGDILHVEPLQVDHYGGHDTNGALEWTFTEAYFVEKHNNLCLDFIETASSAKNRSKTKESTANSESDKEEEKIAFKVASNKTHTLGVLKMILGWRLSRDPNTIRVFERSNGIGEGRLLKDLSATLGQLLVRVDSSPTLSFALLDSPEELKKGDKLLRVRYYNEKSSFEGQLEVKINKHETLRALKTRLKELTGVPEDLQVISEWYNDHFYKLFPNEADTVASARIRKADVLRMDVVADASLVLNAFPSPQNINESSAGDRTTLAFQLVEFMAWDSTSYGRKEMQTTFPSLLTIPEEATIFDLRIAERAKIPWHNINIASARSFPIYEGSITPIKDILKTNANPEDMQEESEEDIAAVKLAEQENRDGKTFSFAAEKKLSLKRSRLRSLEILCWEDLRKKVDRENIPSKQKWDSESLKIKN